MIRFYAICLISSFFLTPIATAIPNSQSDTIIIKDRAGIIQEKRVKSIQSQIIFTPKSMAPYNITAITDDGTDGLNQHTDTESLSIPMWTLFSW